MKYTDFKDKYYKIREDRDKQISDLFSILSGIESKILDFESQNSFDKLLIENLLHYSIVLSNSCMQGLLEDITSLIENYIISNFVPVNKLNKKLYDLYFKKHQQIIIRDCLVYGENVNTNDLGSFLDRNKFNNLELSNGSSNTINFKNFKEIYSLILINIEDVVLKLSVENSDYKKFVDGRISERTLLTQKHKYRFYEKLIEDLNEKRNEIAHGKNIKSNTIIETYNLFILFKEYIFSKFMIQIDLEIKNNIKTNIYFK